MTTKEKNDAIDSYKKFFQEVNSENRDEHFRHIDNLVSKMSGGKQIQAIRTSTQHGSRDPIDVGPIGDIAVPPEFEQNIDELERLIRLVQTHQKRT